MTSIECIIIGAGHSGLTVSSCLRDLGIEHVILERGDIAQAWRTQRWPSLRLLTPNWQNGLRDFAYRGDDPDGFMTAAEFADSVLDYAAYIDAPVMTGSEVVSVRFEAGRYAVTVERMVDGEKRTQVYSARAVVLANGACSLPDIPSVAANIPPSLQTYSAFDYRDPEDLPDGPVLVVGASATGIQLANEIHASGREVTLSVGEHVRLPRRYRGKDIQWWLNETGVLDETYEDIDDLQRARNIPSPQIVGTEDNHTLDLNALSEKGVALVGRFAGLHQGQAQFSGSLKNVCKLADLKMNRLLNTIDEWVEEAGLDDAFPVGERPEATRVPAQPPLLLPLDRFGSVLWATGFKPDWSFLELEGVFDRKGRLRHNGGTVGPGLYVIGLTFLRRRKSSFILGAQADAEDISRHLADYLAEI